MADKLMCQYCNKNPAVNLVLQTGFDSQGNPRARMKPVCADCIKKYNIPKLGDANASVRNVPKEATQTSQD